MCNEVRDLNVTPSPRGIELEPSYKKQKEFESVCKVIFFLVIRGSSPTGFKGLPSALLCNF